MSEASNRASRPAYFIVKPELILKGGMIAYAQIGDPNASIPTPQPVFKCPQFSTFGRAIPESCLTFVSKVSLEAEIGRKYGLLRPLVAVENCRTVTKKDLIHNDATPEIRVDADT